MKTEEQTQIAIIDHKEFGLEESKANQIMDSFRTVFEKVIELEPEFNEVVSMDIDAVATPFKAKELRKKYVKIRTERDGIHKNEKAFFLNAGRFCDKIKNSGESITDPKEEKLKAIENHWENKEKARINEINLSRCEMLKQYNVDGSQMNLGSMDDNIWISFLSGTKMQFEVEQAEIKRKEAEAIELERLKAEEQARVAAENAKLKAEIEAKEKLAAEEKRKAGAELAKVEALRKAEQEKADKILEAQRKTAADKLAKEKSIADAKLKAEQEASAKLKAELQAKEDAERKAEAEERAKKLAEDKARTKALNAPEKTKLIALSKTIRAIELPTVSTDEAKLIVQQVEALIRKLCTFIDDKSETL